MQKQSFGRVILFLVASFGLRRRLLLALVAQFLPSTRAPLSHWTAKCVLFATGYVRRSRLRVQRCLSIVLLSLVLCYLKLASSKLRASGRKSKRNLETNYLLALAFHSHYCVFQLAMRVLSRQSQRLLASQLPATLATDG